jgi:hypothetical protein
LNIVNSLSSWESFLGKVQRFSGLISNFCHYKSLTIFILALHEIGEQLHEAREFWGIGKNCPCKRSRNELKVSATIQELPDEDKNIIVDVVGENPPLHEQGTHCIITVTFLRLLQVHV